MKHVPAYRQVLHGDDSNTMPFAPFADDPSFDFAEYAEEYENFAWQDDLSPDGGVPIESSQERVLTRFTIPEKWICLETARRVHNDKGVSLMDIDASGILPYKIIPHAEDREAGLIWWAKMK